MRSTAPRTRARTPRQGRPHRPGERCGHTARRGDLRELSTELAGRQRGSPRNAWTIRSRPGAEEGRRGHEGRNTTASRSPLGRLPDARWLALSRAEVRLTRRRVVAEPDDPLRGVDLFRRSSRAGILPLVSGLDRTKSAVARLHQSTLQTTAIRGAPRRRRRVAGARRIPEEVQEMDPPLRDRGADLLIPPSGPLRNRFTWSPA